LEKTWLVMCPNWQKPEHTNKAQGWALFKKVIEAIDTDYFSPKIDCIICGKKFSLQQGVSEAFASDIVIDHFRHNSYESGKIEIVVGSLTKIQFTKPFLDIPEINITPYLKPVNAVSGYITSEGFVIFSSANGCSINEKRQITWHASGNRASAPIPLWRLLLSSSKEHQKMKNLRSEIVELESAFEVFFSEYLAKNLKTRLRQKTIEWILKNRIESQMTIGYRELTGQNIRIQYPIEYSKWQNCVKNVRDRIVHQGMMITSEQAINARKAFFNFLTRLDNTTMEHFQIQMNKTGIDGPRLSFGMATITGTQ
jgi:hypothetical protein